MKKFNTNTTLALVTVISTLVAIYNYYQFNSLKNDTLSIANTPRKKTDSKKNKVSLVDSLVLSGAYEKALQFSKQFEKDSIHITDRNFFIKSKMIEEIATLNKKIKHYQQLKSHNTSPKVNLNTSSKDIINDSLAIALKTTNTELENLKFQLNKNKPDETKLEFKTSKGTSLYYVGDVKNHKANGYGVAVLESGSRYEGFWKNNMRHGKGHFFWNDGQHYNGDYKKDKRNGFGIYYWENGDRYEGEWKDDKRNGKGKFYNKKGKLKAEGTWKNDKLTTK